MPSKANVRLPDYQLEWLDERPGTRTAAVRQAVALAMRRESELEADVGGELRAAWDVLVEVGRDYDDRVRVPVGAAETRLADRLNTPKADVRQTYLEPLRQAGVVIVRAGWVWVAKPPEEAAHA